MPSDKVVVVTSEITIKGETWPVGSVGYPDPVPGRDEEGEYLFPATPRILFSRVDGIPVGALALYDSTWLEDPQVQGCYDLVDRV